MLSILLRLKNGLAKALEFAVVLAVGLLVLDVLWQVVTRFASKIPGIVPLPGAVASFLQSVKPSSWTEELATMLLIWVSLLGASVAFSEKGHLGVDYFVSKLPEKAKSAVEIIVYLLVAFFAAMLLIYGGWKLVALTLSTNQRSPALDVNMGHVYLALPISGLFIVLFSLEMIVEKLSPSRTKESAD